VSVGGSSDGEPRKTSRTRPPIVLHEPARLHARLVGDRAPRGPGAAGGEDLGDGVPAVRGDPGRDEEIAPAQGSPGALAAQRTRRGAEKARDASTAAASAAGAAVARSTAAATASRWSRPAAGPTTGPTMSHANNHDITATPERRCTSASMP
jgi:hypothetical protein